MLEVIQRAEYLFISDHNLVASHEMLFFRGFQTPKEGLGIQKCTRVTAAVPKNFLQGVICKRPYTTAWQRLNLIPCVVFTGCFLIVNQTECIDTEHPAAKHTVLTWVQRGSTRRAPRRCKPGEGTNSPHLPHQQCSPSSNVMAPLV